MSFDNFILSDELLLLLFFMCVRVRACVRALLLVQQIDFSKDDTNLTYIFQYILIKHKIKMLEKKDLFSTKLDILQHVCIRMPLEKTKQTNRAKQVEIRCPDNNINCSLGVVVL